MRTFVAIPLPRECQTMLQQLQLKLREFQADVRWAAIPSIHLTLKFLGEVDPAAIPALADSLNRAAGPENALRLRLQGLGCFPHPRNPRIVWCGIGGDTENLAKLQQAVETACVSLGFDREQRPFHPHLTLGRVNGKRNLQPLMDYIKMGSDLGAAFIADHCHVYKSALKPQGAEYTVLKTIRLGAPAETTDD